MTYHCYKSKSNKENLHVVENPTTSDIHTTLHLAFIDLPYLKLIKLIELGKLQQKIIFIVKIKIIIWKDTPSLWFVWRSSLVWSICVIQGCLKDLADLFMQLILLKTCFFKPKVCLLFWIDIESTFNALFKNLKYLFFCEKNILLIKNCDGKKRICILNSGNWRRRIILFISVCYIKGYFHKQWS